MNKVLFFSGGIAIGIGLMNSTDWSFLKVGDVYTQEISDKVKGRGRVSLAIGVVAIIIGFLTDKH